MSTEDTIATLTQERDGLRVVLTSEIDARIRAESRALTADGLRVQLDDAKDRLAFLTAEAQRVRTRAEKAERARDGWRGRALTAEVSTVGVRIGTHGNRCPGCAECREPTRCGAHRADEAEPCANLTPCEKHPNPGHPAWERRCGGSGWVASAPSEQPVPATQPEAINAPPGRCPESWGHPCPGCPGCTEAINAPPGIRAKVDPEIPLTEMRRERDAAVMALAPLLAPVRDLANLHQPVAYNPWTTTARRLIGEARNLTGWRDDTAEGSSVAVSIAPDKPREARIGPPPVVLGRISRIEEGYDTADRDRGNWAAGSLYRELDKKPGKGGLFDRGVLTIAQDVHMTTTGAYGRDDSMQSADVDFLRRLDAMWLPSLPHTRRWDDAVRCVVRAALASANGVGDVPAPVAPERVERIENAPSWELARKAWEALREIYVTTPMDRRRPEFYAALNCNQASIDDGDQGRIDAAKDAHAEIDRLEQAAKDARLWTVGQKFAHPKPDQHTPLALAILDLRAKTPRPDPIPADVPTGQEDQHDADLRATEDGSPEDKIRTILADVAFPGYNLHVGQITGTYLQVRYEETDVDTGRPAAQHGRKWYISSHATRGEVVQTALKAILTSAEHRVREHFTYRGARLFGPHFDIEKLADLASGHGALDVRMVPDPKPSEISKPTEPTTKETP